MIINHKKQGFTLIELLAVIVILAVIALIAVPQILNILNRVRLSAAEDTTSGIIKSAENYVTSFMLQNNGMFPDGTVTFKCDGNNCKLITIFSGYNLENLNLLNFKGTKPTSGTITISNSGKNILVFNLQINGFICNSTNDNITCGTENKEYDNVEQVLKNVLSIVYLDPTDLNVTCNENNIVSKTGTNKGCMKWYVYKDDGTNYTMIADHNITENVAWYREAQDNTKGPKEVLESLREATSSWDNKLISPGSYEASWTDKNSGDQSYTINYEDYGNRARLISAEEIADITGASKSADDGGIGWNFKYTQVFYLDGIGEKWETPVGSSSQKSKYAWLFDNTNDCIKYGCNVEQLDTWGYWTSSSNGSGKTGARGIYYNGSLNFFAVDGNIYYGVRPVITVKKSDLLK